MKSFLFILFVFNGFYSIGQLSVKEVKKRAIPSFVTYEGNFNAAKTWKDGLGSHFVILSGTDDIEKSDSDYNYRQRFLYARHYLVKKDSAQLLWKLLDVIPDCPVDIILDFIMKGFRITDLDKDKIPEVWVTYTLGCRGDVSPDDLKIIMYEGSRKHVLRGSQTMTWKGKVQVKGRHKLDNAFLKAPKVIHYYALALWNKYSTVAY
ncbi:MAG TPA: hypothetical protein VMR70_05305 [Flavisolibacter sp.]|nr:hypothetical protein [Flavisolibacter sp.]